LGIPPQLQAAEIPTAGLSIVSAFILLDEVILFVKMPRVWVRPIFGGSPGD
jgi:hypothetical protein